MFVLGVTALLKSEFSPVERWHHGRCVNRHGRCVNRGHGSTEQGERSRPVHFVVVKDMGSKLIQLVI